MPIVILLLISLGIAKVFSLSYFLVLAWTGTFFLVIVIIKLILVLSLRKKLLN